MKIFRIRPVSDLDPQPCFAEQQDNTGVLSVSGDRGGAGVSGPMLSLLLLVLPVCLPRGWPVPRPRLPRLRPRQRRPTAQHHSPDCQECLRHRGAAVRRRGGQQPVPIHIEKDCGRMNLMNLLMSLKKKFQRGHFNCVEEIIVLQ